VTLVVHDTDRKHDDRYHFYWYFTIPALTVILLTIMICNVTHIYSETSYTKSVVSRNLQKIPHLEMNPEVHQKFPQNSNLVPVSYSPMRVEGSQSLSPTLYKQWLEAENSNRQDGQKGDENELLPRILQHREETKKIP
jgi:hypothetical protein